MDEYLKKYNLKWEDLNAEERVTLQKWMDSLTQGQLTVERIRDYVKDMKAAVEEELTKYDLGSKQDMLLKARLRNYMLLEGFLDSPLKAQREMDKAIKNIR